MCRKKWERKVEAVRLLPHRYPLVAGLPQQAPGAGREGLARQFRQRLRAAETATCPADEQEAGEHGGTLKPRPGAATPPQFRRPRPVGPVSTEHEGSSHDSESFRRAEPVILDSSSLS